MAWLMVILACVFGYVSLSMFVAGFKETNEAERFKLMRSGFGTLVLTLMGIVFAWNSFHLPPTP
ncbi:MAG: GerAB/ArcD/ProY family transporter [Candidatus Sericytochromatia bacterium]